MHDYILARTAVLLSVIFTHLLVVILYRFNIVHTAETEALRRRIQNVPSPNVGFYAVAPAERSAERA